MDASRFDAITKLFADRRLSRRQALKRATAGVTAGALATAGLSVAAAQDATPVPGDATPAAGDDVPAMYFVQSFNAGSVAPDENAEGRYTLSLEHGLGQTIYFSDRPYRIVGAMPTDAFLNSLGFPADNPPNAALVVQQPTGETEIAVVELFNPTFAADGPNVTYSVQVLEEWERTLDVGLQTTPADLGALSTNFGTAHLFIDGVLDCPDHDMVCYTDTNQHPSYSQVGVIPNADHGGYCTRAPQLICDPCYSPERGGTWQDECNRRFPTECNGNCHVWPTCTSAWTECSGWGV